jgi:hypothetical protein
MASHAIIATDRTAPGLGSLQGSMAYLQQQSWWAAFRDGRRGWAQPIDDVLWVGHFCGWLQRERMAVERCTKTDIDAYLASIASFRPGPRAACQRTVTELIDFFAARAPISPIERC